MKKQILIALCVILGSVSLASAQNSVLKGSFKRIAYKDVLCEDIHVFLKDKGQMKHVLENVMKKGAYTFQFGIGPDQNMFNKICYVGTNGEYFPVYIAPDNTVEINVENGKINYAGELNKENQVFANYYKIINPLHEMMYTNKARAVSEDEIAKVLNEITPQALNFVKQVKTGNVNFDNYIKFMLPFSLQNDVLQLYAQGRSFPSDAYPEYIKNLFSQDNFNSMKILELPFGYDLMLMYGFAKECISNKRMGTGITFAIDNISCNELKGEVALWGMENNCINEDLNVFAGKYKKFFVTKEQNERFEKLYRILSLRMAGGNWVDFSYPDIDNVQRKLSDYKGKVVVIDVWASWCAPCRAEFPSLKKLEEELQGKDVVFIGLSLDTNHKDWADMVKKENLLGVQLYTNREGVIINDYKIEAVPQFIVFSKEGKTVSFNAPRPSSPKLKEIIETELKK
ncbi:MAG: TlpA disulfide reductase family protein [Bacteroidales bacterium]|nr:TlpA disulfide reductase family protein [Bacteroidales bacterium]